MTEKIKIIWEKQFDIILLSLGLIIKLLFFHYYIGIREGLILKSFSNLISVLGIGVLIFSLGGKRRARIMFLINVFLSTLFFINVMYYSHFYTLMPAHSILQIGQLGPVSQSIISLIRVEYLLFFLDTLLLIFLYSKKDIKIFKGCKSLNLNKDTRLSYLFVFIVLSLITSSTTFMTIRNTQGLYTPQNLGVINYYFADIVDLFYKNPIAKEQAEEVIETIIETNGEEGTKGFSIAKDRNIIVIQAESLQNFVINREIEGQYITPVLNELIKGDSIYFNNYYEQVGWGNTSDAEFISHNSFYPSIKNYSYKVYKDNDFASLPSLLMGRGYSTIAFHGNHSYFWNRDKMYPSQGIDKFISLDDFRQDEMIGIGLSDGSMFKQSIDILKKVKPPFYSFFITLTSHHPFAMDDEYKGLKIEGEFKDTLLEDYLQSIHYLDKELGNFIEGLKKAGLYENTMICIYGDHEGLDMRNEDTQELLSSFLEKSYRQDEMHRVPLLIHIPDSGYKKVVNTAGGQIDFLPTLSNLIGLEIDNNKMFGRDLLNIQEGFVANQVHVARGSFIDDEKIFIMSEDGIFENSQAWNIKTGQAIDLEECREGYERALGEVNLSEYILQNNLIPFVQEKGLKYIVENLES